MDKIYLVVKDNLGNYQSFTEHIGIAFNDIDKAEFYVNTRNIEEKTNEYNSYRVEEITLF